MNQFPSKNYFTMPNEIFSLGAGRKRDRSVCLSSLP